VIDMEREELEEIFSLYKRHINPYLADLLRFAGFDKLEWEAEGCIIKDSEGNEYIDCLGGYGVFSLGHRHPKVVEAVEKQLHLMPLSSKVFINPLQARLGERLSEITPGDLQCVFFSNSGTEAVEAALKFARMYTGRKKFVSALGSFHGKTLVPSPFLEGIFIRSHLNPCFPIANRLPLVMWRRWRRRLTMRQPPSY